jgi:hypothetical protein
MRHTQRMSTLGIWLGPTLAVAVAAAGTRWLGWFRPRVRRRVALRRIAERLASDDSQGYPYMSERYLEHYLGGRRADQEWDKASTRAADGTYYDARGPQPRWWQRRPRA